MKGAPGYMNEFASTSMDQQFDLNLDTDVAKRGEKLHEFEKQMRAE